MKNQKQTVKQINEEIKRLDDTNNVSDGYHTFGELYEHRIVLFIALCRMLCDRAEVWFSDIHSDGSKIDGWFSLGVGKEKGEQITYHLPIRYWKEVAGFAKVLEKAPEWDGHTSKDVLKRLKTL